MKMIYGVIRPSPVTLYRLPLKGKKAGKRGATRTARNRKSECGWKKENERTWYSRQVGSIIVLWDFRTKRDIKTVETAVQF